MHSLTLSFLLPFFRSSIQHQHHGDDDDDDDEDIGDQIDDGKTKMTTSSLLTICVGLSGRPQLFFLPRRPACAVLNFVNYSGTSHRSHYNPSDSAAEHSTLLLPS